MARYTNQQVMQRRRILAAVIAVTVLALVASCGTLVVQRVVGALAPPGSTFATPRNADDDAMSIDRTPPEAAGRTQLPEGIVLEDGEELGIDVSAHQGTVDWPQVHDAGVRFAYIKATEGSNFQDDQFRRNWDGARDAGITTGAYHYFTLCSPGADQAHDFLAAVEPDDTALPPVIDLEFDGACDARPEAQRATAEIDDFIRIVEDAWGRKVVLYSSSEWREHYGLPDDRNRPLWLYDDQGRPDGDWSVWQVRFDAEIAGIDGDVDLDVIRLEHLREKAIIDDPPDEDTEETP
ncbi:MAG: GH25 family lysozyme [Brachybacterium sp.]|nr:GH25 family lysozyme [Brachybacterium sp.]